MMNDMQRKTRIYKNIYKVIMIICGIWFLLYSIDARGQSVDEFECLAKNIYFEARSESNLAQQAVAWVTLNRLTSAKFPNTICGVVKQGKKSKWWKDYNGEDRPVRNSCAFSWYCDGRSDRIHEEDAFMAARMNAYFVVMVYKRGVDPTNNADHYHADYVKPIWGKKEYQTAQLGSHIFYNLP